MSHYAVIKTGGKQHRVAVGDVVYVEQLAGEIGQTIELDQVLMVTQDNDCNFGNPLVEGAKVSAEVTKQGRAKKINILKFKRRKHHMKRQGHRQNFTQLTITGITHT